MHFEKKDRDHFKHKIYLSTISAIQIRILIIKKRTRHLMYDLQKIKLNTRSIDERQSPFKPLIKAKAKLKTWQFC